MNQTVDFPNKTNAVVSLPLRFVLIIPFVFQIFLAVGLTGLFALRNGRKAVDNLVNQLQEQVTEEVEQHINNHLSLPQQINETNASLIKRNLLDLEDRESVQRHFWNQLQIYGEYTDYIYIGYAEGGFDMATLEDNNKSTIQFSETLAAGKSLIYSAGTNGYPDQYIDSYDYDSRGRPWFKGAVEKRSTFWSNAYLSKQIIPNFATTVSLPIYKKNGELLGVVANDIYLTGISNFLKELKIGKTGKLFIVENTGFLLGTSTEDPTYFRPDATAPAEQILANDSSADWIKQSTLYLESQLGDLNKINEPERFQWKFAGETYFLLVTPIRNDEGLNWSVISLIPRSDFMAEIEENTRQTIILCVASLFIATISGILTARWISKSVKLVSTTAKDLSEGNLDVKVPTQSLQELDILAQSFNAMSHQLKASFQSLELANLELENRVQERTIELEKEKERSEQLLRNVLPETIAEQLKENQDAIAEHYDEVTILFADIVGFTLLAERLAPLELVNLLNQIFSQFDSLVEELGLEKIKTIGDAYMVAAGLPMHREDHTQVIAQMGLAMLDIIDSYQRENNSDLQIRIGMNTGMVVAGVIGTKKFIYDLWGDTVNVASRMESSGEAGKIQVTQAVHEKLQDIYHLEPRGFVEIKGKGEMQTYWLLSKV